MVLELVAGRLTARHLGSSLYTWTSVIGVVLAGITVGNYLGGRIADRFAAKKSAGLLFLIGSVSCVLTIILNNLVAHWQWLWLLNWPARTLTHVLLVFMLPSTILGTISPVIAKMALDRGLATGKTVGSIYAWSAAGSIAGTFAAGYWLIATLGTTTIIWIVAAVMLACGFFYWWRFRLLYIWMLLLLCCMVLGMGPWRYVQKAGVKIGLRNKPDPKGSLRR